MVLLFYKINLFNEISNIFITDVHHRPLLDHRLIPTTKGETQKL